jgi:hypothetical protein
MLIKEHIVEDILNCYNISVKGVLHIGAHECEELPFYKNYLKVSNDNIIWIDGNKDKVDKMQKKGFTTIYHSVIDEEDNKDIIFNITDNSQASSILCLNHEKGFYNSINIIKTVNCKTEKLSTFFTRINKNPSDYNFWNLDIQGSEFFVLRGSKELLHMCDAIYTEVNSEHVYKNCGLITEIDTLLQEYGFKRIHTVWTDVKWGDALYIKIKSDM